MAHDDNAKKEVRRLYAFGNLSLASCAVSCKVSYATAVRWKKQAKELGDDWDKVKSAHQMAGGGIEDISREILTGLMIEYKTTMDKLQNDENLSAQDRVALLASLSDSYNKSVGASRKLMPETSELATAMKVLDKFAKFIQENKPELLEAFVDVLEHFGEMLEKELK